MENEDNDENVNEQDHDEQEINSPEENDLEEDLLDNDPEEDTSTNEQSVEKNVKDNSDIESNRKKECKSNISFGSGYGACYKCGCRRFEGTTHDDICHNCGHSYYDHS